MAVNVLALMMTTSLGGFPLSDNTMPDGASGKQARHASCSNNSRNCFKKTAIFLATILHHLTSSSLYMQWGLAVFLQKEGTLLAHVWSLKHHRVVSALCFRIGGGVFLVHVWQCIFYFGSSTTAHIEIFLTGSQGAANHSVDSAASQSNVRPAAVDANAWNASASLRSFPCTPCFTLGIGI